MNKYTTGTLVRLPATLTTIDGVLVNPTTLTCKIKLPDNTISDLTTSIVHEGTGKYYVDYTPLVIGVFNVEWIGTGTAQITGIHKFEASQATF